MVGLPGIEPGLHAPEACVIPLYHSPNVDLGRIGLPPPQCECGVVPLDYRPQIFYEVKKL